MNQLKVGLLALAAIASFAVVSLKITANKSGFGNYIEYRTTIPDATGIFEKSSIKVAGITAGSIKKIKLKDSEAEIIFEVAEAIKVTRNSVLKIKSVGFLGDKYLDIYLGDPRADRLKEGEFVPSKDVGGLADVGKDVGEVLAEVKDILKTVKEGLRTQEGENLISEIMLNVRDITKDIKKVAKTLKKVTTNNEGKLQEIIDNITEVSDNLAYETNKDNPGSLLADIKPIIEQLGDVSQDLSIVVSDIKAGKGTVGKLLRDEEVVDQVSETLSNVNRLVQRVNNIEADIALFSGVNSKYGGYTQFDLDLFPAPERFYRLGFVSNDFGPEIADEKETTTTTGSTSSTVTERVVDKNGFKFNLQIGRRLQRFAIRAGLIETTAGVGADYLFPGYSSRISMEVFDYQDDVGPNVRLRGELKLWNVLHTRLSAEDLASPTGDQTFTISFGLRFTDQDLAALIGLLAN